MLSNALKIVLGLLAVAIGVVVSWCASHNVWSQQDYYNYRAMCEWNHPVLHALRNGDIHQGSTAAELRAVAAPERTLEYGRLVYYYYTPRMSFDTVWLSTVDGRVTSAQTGSCTWHWTFFDNEPKELSIAANVVETTLDFVEQDPSKADVLRPLLEDACQKLQMPMPELVPAVETE